MKLTQSDVTNLVSILGTCSIAGIESLIIEEGKIRGVNEAKTAVIISDANIPVFSQKIGIARISLLRNRLGLFNDNLVLDAKESDRGEIVSLELSSQKAKAQFRCTPTMLIKAPKVINDQEFVRVSLTKDEMRQMLNAAKVMCSKKIGLKIKAAGEVSFSATDESNDQFVSTVEASAEFLTDTTSMYHDYPTDIISAVLRKAADDYDSCVLRIGEAGTLTTRINGHDITILPIIDNSDD